MYDPMHMYRPKPGVCSQCGQPARFFDLLCPDDSVPVAKRERVCRACYAERQAQGRVVKYPVVFVDWDYHTFSILDEEGDDLILLDAEDEAEFVWVEGFLWCGKSIERTIYQRVKDHETDHYHYKRYIEPTS